MKTSPKLTLILASLLLLAAPLLRAADDPATPPPANADQPKRERRGPGGGPGAMMERIAKELNLTADQQAKWKEIAEQEKAALKPIMDDQSLSREDKRAKMMDLNKGFADQRRAVLDPDQQKKFDEAIAKMRERGPRGPRKEGGDTPPPPPPASSN